MLSNNTEFKKLLLLHGKDRRKRTMELELSNSPNLISSIDNKIDLEEKTIESVRNELSLLETKSNSLENEIDSLSDQVSRLKNKQLEVKKNEEYQALSNEISCTQKQQSSLEDEQLQILIKLDDARETLKIAQDKISKKIELLQNEKSQLLDRIDDLKNEISKLDLEIIDSTKDVDNSILASYEQTKKIVSRPPYIAPLNEQKCTGCNLRVSNDVVSSVLVEQKLTQCDQCGRIVYCER